MLKGDRPSKNKIYCIKFISLSNIFIFFHFFLCFYLQISSGKDLFGRLLRANLYNIISWYRQTILLIKLMVYKIRFMHWNEIINYSSFHRKHLLIHSIIFSLFSCEICLNTWFVAPWIFLIIFSLIYILKLIIMLIVIVLNKLKNFAIATYFAANYSDHLAG